VSPLTRAVCWIAAASGLALTAGVPSRTSAASREPGLPDTAVVAAVLAAGRGANPLLCELALRSIDRPSRWNGDMGWVIGVVPGDYALRRGDARVQRVAPAALEALHDPAAIAPLRSAIGDADPCVRRLAASLLGRLHHPRAVAALSAALTDRDTDTRAMAALGLGLAQEAATGPALLAALRDTAPPVRALAAWALGEIEDVAASGALTRLLRGDPDRDVRMAAAWALGNLN
jgi:HEAT repeat protein